MDKRKGTNE